MIILGLTSPLSWNQAAAIIKDGKFLAAVEEERFNRIKHSPRMPPFKSIEFCLKFAKAEPAEVDAIALGYRSPLDYYWRSVIENLKEKDFTRLIREGGALAEYMVGTVRLMDWLKEKGFRMKGADKMLIKFYPHHLVHAASTYRCSGFNQANVITLDGQGEDDSGSIWRAQDHQMKKIYKVGHHQSVGWVYHVATDVLGFKPHSHEGKVMGLAAWGRRRLKTDDLWQTWDDGYKIKHGWCDRFWQKFGPRRQREEILTERHKNIALTVQDFTEKAGISLINKAYKETGIKNFCLAGGVALNCDMNARIWELPYVDKIFIQPASDDAGTAIGGALELANELGENADFTMNHAYWGPIYSNEEIEAVLKESKLGYEKVKDIEKLVARELSRGKIVGWFQGRLEIGPRALGNRSILAHPGLPGMKDKINKEVKHREPWRPFAPSILHEKGEEYFEEYCFNPFMLLTLKCRKKALKDLSQAIHIDGTARHQSVTRETNSRYYKLISEFAKITGIPAVLNTSFNDRDEPLVNTPKDALKMFSSTGLDILAIGDFIVSKGKLF